VETELGARAVNGGAEEEEEWAVLGGGEGAVLGGEMVEEGEEEEEEEEEEIDVTTSLPSLPDGAISSVYHSHMRRERGPGTGEGASASSSESSATVVGGGGGGGGGGRKRRRGKRGQQQQQQQQEEGEAVVASHHYTVRERVWLFFSLWPYTVPLVRAAAFVGVVARVSFFYLMSYVLCLWLCGAKYRASFAARCCCLQQFAVCRVPFACGHIIV
jgi:hypothetical protein